MKGRSKRFTSERPCTFRVACPGDGYSRNPFEPKPGGALRDIRWHRDRFWVEWGPAEDLVTILGARGDADATPFGEVVNTAPFRDARYAPRALASMEAGMPQFQEAKLGST